MTEIIGVPLPPEDRAMLAAEHGLLRTLADLDGLTAAGIRHAWLKIRSQADVYAATGALATQREALDEALMQAMSRQTGLPVEHYRMNQPPIVDIPDNPGSLSS